MKYVLLGNLNAEWASKQADRIGKATAKLDKLGIKLESILYTQGRYDFVDVVDAPNAEAMLAFVLADALLELTGGDRMDDVRERLETHRARLRRYPG